MRETIALGIIALVSLYAILAIIGATPGLGAYEKPDASVQFRTPRQPQTAAESQAGKTTASEATQPPSTQQEHVNATVTLSMDKETYHSGEEMKATVLIEDGEGEAELKVFGVKDQRGSYRVQGSRVVELGASLEENFTFRMPSCYGCAGVAPGDYPITAELRQNGTLTGSAEKVVSLQK